MGIPDTVYDLFIKISFFFRPLHDNINRLISHPMAGFLCKIRINSYQISVFVKVIIWLIFITAYHKICKSFCALI